MTDAEWLAALTIPELQGLLEPLGDRQLHRLTAAFLRRVWDFLPSEHFRLAVEETERFADGRTTPAELARVRSTDLLETCEGLWLGPDDTHHDEQLMGGGCLGCDVCDARAEAYATKSGYVLDGVVSGVREPSWVAAQAAFVARELVGWAAEPDDAGAADREAMAQLGVLRELVGGAGGPPRLEPEWLTGHVRALARVIDRDRDYGLLPVLADALEDAGCTDAAVIGHCRGPGPHLPGCWLVELFVSH